MLPCNVARKTILNVMINNKDKGDKWKTQLLEEHIDHAISHLACALESDSDEDHLAHALTRVAMAICVKENTA
jgi:hypothetical protein